MLAGTTVNNNNQKRWTINRSDIINDVSNAVDPPVDFQIAVLMIVVWVANSQGLLYIPGERIIGYL
ncbi:hypothetical protein BJX99DRAFT_241713 [Aspergillus californicus]